jgi:hypothetical protein
MSSVCAATTPSRSPRTIALCQLSITRRTSAWSFEVDVIASAP